jgi:hypothetical protein
MDKFKDYMKEDEGQGIWGFDVDNLFEPTRKAAACFFASYKAECSEL